MTLANKITVSRFFLTGIFVILILKPGSIFKILALSVFIAASVTDVLDGYFAKKRNEISALGKLLDPIADKTLTLSAFITFAVLGIVPAWIVAIITLRELVITAFRVIALRRGRVIEAARSGKHKTVSQVVAIYAILIFMVLNVEYEFRNIVFFMMLATTALTLISGAGYLSKTREYLFNEKTR